MPVRVKQRAVKFSEEGASDEKDIHMLKRQLVAMLLGWHLPVSVSLNSTDGKSKKFIIRSKDSSSVLQSDKFTTLALATKSVADARTFDLALICSVLSQASYIELSEWDTWVKTSARTSTITIMGVISLQPAPSKHVQFISLGIQPIHAEIGGNVLSEDINRAFALSNFGNQEEIDNTGEERRSKDRRFKQDGFTNKQLKGGGKGVDRWPMFYIRIELQQGNDVQKLQREGVLANILKILGAMIQGFLKDNHFRPRARIRSPPKQQSRKPAKHKMPLDANDAFSTWSRVKSGKRIRIKGQPIESGSPNDQVEAINGPSLRTPDTLHQTAGSSPATQPSAAEDLITAAEENDPPIQWMNPVSKSKMLINSRTGLVVSQPPQVRRPNTAPPILQSSKHHPAHRITRRSSNPPVPPQPGTWVSSLLSKWENPIFAPTEKAIPQLSLNGPSLELPSGPHDHTHHCSSALFENPFTHPPTINTKLSKQSLSTARVIAQIDKKFILTTFDQGTTQTLVLIDQHAADERIRLEALLHDLHNIPPAHMDPALTFSIPAREVELFASSAAYFERWGITYTLPPGRHISVHILPAVITSRCRLDPNILLSFLRTEVWSQEQNLSLAKTSKTKPQTPPQGLLDMLNSRACRSAIMFNDILTVSDCETLVQRLAGCDFPFVCAHGRVSMVPLVCLGEGSGFGRGGGGTGFSPELQGKSVEEREIVEFGQAWEKWKRKQGAFDGAVHF